MGIVKTSESKETEFYNAFVTRNWPIITPQQQEAVSKVRLAVGGCGSVGGAFVDGAVRLGVNTFHLADNGDYELNNLNRQMVTLNEIGTNKAVAYGSKVLSVNSYASVKVWKEGITERNIESFLDDSDLIFDGVDVTTENGMQMKLLLHEVCSRRRLPVVSALDLGFTQWLRGFDYREGILPLDGRLEEARSARHPLKALIGPFCPVEDLSLEITEEAIRLLKEPNGSACQLGSACFLLAAMVTPYMLHFVEEKRLPSIVKVDLLAPFTDPKVRGDKDEMTKRKHDELRSILDRIE